uniref:NADH-ubiquinone oxidoreductase chain 5 n=1 Tax=Coccidophilus cariba TaxID=2743657 RepID=A0A6N0GXR3_9CUCU|nr:NADH dehydrogenase subunit 5 [Coccidophilus cariba]
MLICLIFSFSFFLFFLIFFIFGIYFIFKDSSYIFEYSLLFLNSSDIQVLFLFDWMSFLFMSFVLLISSMVIFYSQDYMESEKNLSRFIMLVILFVFSMMFLIISPNLISILLGWDGLGLVSYCLVVYYQNVKSYNAGMLTILSNRIGDVMFLMSIAWMMNYGSWNFLFYIDFMKNDYEMKLILILMILAAMTKSAQIPFSSWLPAAMAAPTPVSSLVHSSTLVTAGVYLLIRFNVGFSFNMKMFLLLISLLTMFMSGLGANFEFDLKKIIALSTLSQLGLMMSILALGDWMLSFYHLLVHALFKALLFMCAGNIIHNLSNCQDIRFMGSLINKMPLTCVYFNVSNLSLCGLPFFSGFYSKDLIVEFMSMGYLNLFVYLIFYISIGLTVSYSFRLISYFMLSDFNYLSLMSISDNSKKMLQSMGVLFLAVIFSGSLLNWLMLKTPYFIILPFFMKILTLLMIFLGLILGMEMSKLNFSSMIFSKKFFYSVKFMGSMWNMPFLSTLGLNYLFINMGYKIFKFLDQGWFEYLGAQNLHKKIVSNSLIYQLIFKKNFKLMLILFITWVFMFIYYYI